MKISRLLFFFSFSMTIKQFLMIKIGERIKIAAFDNKIPTMIRSKVLNRIKNNRCPERERDKERKEESVLQYRRKFIYYGQLNIGFVFITEIKVHCRN